MRGTLTLSELEALAYDLGVDLDPAPYRITDKRAPATSMNIVTAIIGEYADEAQPDKSSTIRELRRLAESGELSAHELRRRAREAGVSIGNEREDDEDRGHTAAHEAAHAAAALALGWGVKWVDLARGQCQVEQPAHGDRSFSEIDFERATIATAGGAFTGVNSRRAELEGDRYAVRSLGRARWDEARSEAELMAKDRRVKSLHQTLTNALLASPSGRLEGDSLRAAVEDWEG